jgi:GH15 family glucan-1,4-alpha-glucosidase
VFGPSWIQMNWGLQYVYGRKPVESRFPRKSRKARVESNEMSDPDPGALVHGAIGNGRVLALVAPTTAIEWLCLPRFDSPSVFGSLLDPERGGTFRIDCVGASSSRMEYERNTNVLRTRVTGEDGEFDVFDFAPRIPSGSAHEAPLEIHRLLVPVAGRPRIRVHFDPRPDYGRVEAQILPVESGLEVRYGAQRLFLRSNVPSSYLLNRSEVRVDHPRYFVLSYGKPAQTESAVGVQRTLQKTIDGWRVWSKTCALPSFVPEEVLRSALCLKLHAFTDTGAIIAAATTSIPEALGTERTWDYRYCWLRDSAFVVEALRRLSHLAEGEAFVRFLRDVAERGPLQPVYGVGGERDLPEELLEHLAGYCGTRPVRIGNAAALQQQNDLMGEMVLCLDTLMSDPRIVLDSPPELMDVVSRLVEQAIRVSAEKDMGLWEYRTALRHYTFGRVMCWVAADRGARLARRHGKEELAQRWSAWAAAEREEILSRAYNADLGFFTQALDGKHPDASNLLLATLGFIDADDPRFVSTVRAYERLLVENGLMLRYRHDDDLGQPTTAFSICSFWWSEALAMIGKLDEAVALFKRLLTFANPLGLYSEGIDPRTGRLLGNFPQAYSHVGLIHAAITIGEMLDARDRRFRAWN